MGKALGVLRMSILFVVMVISIPIDFVLWNLIYADGKVQPYMSIKDCAIDGFRHWKSFINE